MKYFTLGFSIAALIAVVLMSNAHASQTLSLEDSYRDGDQTVCVYSDGRHSAVVYKNGAGSCPSKYVKH
ncbi:hypothetical protein P7_269 [Pectobacterium phage vB_PcaM_P7_Pc]|nr:hypothetical protein P7_269 [Pectobacterium phage vB_PcaM_P7_Pc]